MRCACAVCSFATCTHAWSEFHGFCNSEYMARFDGVRREMVPMPELLDRYVEAIGDSDERIAATYGVPLRMLPRRGRSDRNDQLVAHVHAFA